MTDQGFPARDAYAPTPEGWSLPPLSLAERADELLPIRHVFGARIGFGARFDAAAERLSSRGGAAVSPTQAGLFFRDALLMDIDPRRLTHRLSDQIFDGRKARRTDELFLDGGSWDQILFPIDQSPVHGEILDICRMRGEFRRSSRYRWLVKQIEAGRPMARSGIRLDSIQKLDGYYGYYLDLIESIERTGVLRRKGIRLGQHTGRAHRTTRTLWRDLIERDIGVAVGPDGALVRHTSGRHRVAAAIGLGVARVPVEIRMVHARWLTNQARRLGMSPARALPVALRELVDQAA